jgi:hypothetical protein
MHVHDRYWLHNGTVVLTMLLIDLGIVEFFVLWDLNSEPSQLFRYATLGL